MLPTAPPPPDDSALLERARSGDSAAVALLYETHHDAALRLAQILVEPDGAEDLVADAFCRVVARLTAGGGPSSNFHGYLFTAIRNRHRDLQRVAGREEPVSDRPWLLDESIPPLGDTDDVREDDVTEVLDRLSASWRQVLWLLEVEQLSVPAVAERMGITPAAVSSLAYRAREGLRTAYLDHLMRSTPVMTSECTWARQRLGRYVRASLGGNATGRLEAHLRHCEPCVALRDDLASLSRRFTSANGQGRLPHSA